jgi:membrane associated rhomboid family serine protease
MSTPPSADDPAAEVASAAGAEPAGRASAAPRAADPPQALSFPYGRRGGAVELGANGFRAPKWPGRSEAFVAYRDVTHTALEPRALAVGTRHGVLLLGRVPLGGGRIAESLAEAIRARVFALPGGAAQRARFERLDARSRARRPGIAALLVVLCALVAVCQQLVPGFYEAAIYRPGLIALGEWWRYAAAQFLHGSTWHLAVNAAATLIAGAYAERSLGRMGTLFVAGAAGTGAMLASRFGGYQELLGFSGVAAGFFGAIAALEYFAPATAPASARVPRGVLLVVIAAQLALDLMPSPPLPDWATHSAGWAHAGGFLAGGAAALLAVRDGARSLVMAGAVASLLAVVVSFGIVAQSVARPGASLERQAREMLAREVANPGELNNLAWQIATSRRPTKSALAQAVELAERAVLLTAAREPTILDTLAEVTFAQGNAERAIELIDEAIALAPGESYYREQRRRFTGERAADDRPEPPPDPLRPGAPGERDEPPAPGELDLPPGDEITV